MNAETPPMRKAEAAQRIAGLREAINRHNRLYYVEAHPEVSDREYDSLYDELKALETRFPDLVTPDSPTQRVGGEPLKGFTRHRHQVPMLSLDKAEDLRELKLFEARIGRELGGAASGFVVEPKVDGVSISVRYENGLFRLGATRGDGAEGDDITASLKTIREIPLRLRTERPPAQLEVRGEAYLSEAGRLTLNAKLEQAGEKPFPNTRNATAGSLKLLDARSVARRPLRAVFYAVASVAGVQFKTHRAELEAMEAWGLPIPRLWWTCTDVAEAMQRAEELKARQAELPYDIDGVVIKLDDVAQAQKLGRTAKAPASAVAYKPKHWLRQAETRLRDITVQVGRTGVLTPVAELEPVFLDGTEIRRATLHNEDDIKRKDIRIGDTIVVERAGRVIPAVVQAVKEQRPEGAEPFDLIKHIGGKCPACGGTIAKEKVSDGGEDEVAWRCQNVAGCPAQKIRRVEYFAQRKALDIEALGGIVAEKLVESGLVDESLDLFNLTKDQLASLNLGTEEEPRVFGEKNATKVIEALDRARLLPLHRWLHALAIPDIGEQTAFDLAGFFADLPTLTRSSLLSDTAKLGELRQLFKANKVGEEEQALSEAERTARKERQREVQRLGNPIGKRLIEADFARRAGQDWQARTLVGPASAKAIVDWAASEHGRKVLRRMHELGLAPQGRLTLPVSGGENQPGLLTGKTLVLTGTLPTLSRDEASALIRDAGGNVTGSVSKITDYVLAGESAGSKLDRARELGVKVLSEKEFIDMLGHQPKATSGAKQETTQRQLL